MTVTNIVVALMAIATNVTPVRVYTPAEGLTPRVVRDRKTGLFRDTGTYETLYRRTVTTNFTFVSRMEHRLAKPGADIGAVARSTCWVRFCDCPCHGGSVVEHDTVWGRDVPALKSLSLDELLRLQDAVTSEIARRFDPPRTEDLADDLVRPVCPILSTDSVDTASWALDRHAYPFEVIWRRKPK